MAANTILLIYLAMDVPVELPAEVLQSLLDTAPYLFLLGGIERMLTIPLHVAFSILVIVGAVRRQYGFLALAIATHFLLNFPLGWMAENLGFVITELYILAWSIAAWLFILRSKILFNERVS